MKESLWLILVTTAMTTAFPVYPTESDQAGLRNEGREMFLAEQLSRLEARVAVRDCLSTEVSQVDVAWHIDHTFKVINKIYDALEESNPEDYRFNVSPMRWLTFTTGKIPRGRATAPDSVRPPEVILTESLHEQSELARSNLDRLELLPKKSHFKHPVFGTLKRKHARRFLEIHTNHHLAIIEDIVEQCPDEPGL